MGTKPGHLLLYRIKKDAGKGLRSVCVWCIRLFVYLQTSSSHLITSLLLLGTNRFEVTLEKSNKNFSKKIQQVDATDQWLTNWCINQKCSFWWGKIKLKYHHYLLLCYVLKSERTVNCKHSPRQSELEANSLSWNDSGNQTHFKTCSYANLKFQRYLMWLIGW